MKKLYVFKLGSEAKGFIPNKKMFEELKRQLNDCVLNGGDVNVLLTHSFLEIETLDVPDDMKLGTMFDVAWEEMETRHRDEMNRATVAFEGRITEAIDRERALKAQLAEAQKPWYKRLFPLWFGK